MAPTVESLDLLWCNAKCFREAMGMSRPSGIPANNLVDVPGGTNLRLRDLMHFIALERFSIDIRALDVSIIHHGTHRFIACLPASLEELTFVEIEHEGGFTSTHMDHVQNVMQELLAHRRAGGYAALRKVVWRMIITMYSEFQDKSKDMEAGRVVSWEQVKTDFWSAGVELVWVAEIGRAHV